VIYKCEACGEEKEVEAEQKAPVCSICRIEMKAVSGTYVAEERCPSCHKPISQCECEKN
jgi:hypothetical protein